jgi:VIT1/CCC1 family predicted Fe2+/Mn2+ transporter
MSIVGIKNLLFPSSKTSQPEIDLDQHPGESTARWVDPRTVSDAIIGLSDGLTVPFALTAGLSAFNDTRVVILGGCAELIAGSISMGLGGWLAGRGEEEFYSTTLSSTRSLVEDEERGSGVQELVYTVFEPYHVPRENVTSLVSALVRDRDDTVEFLMRFKHELPSREGSKRTPLRSALTIAAGYFLGGIVPLMPYFLVGKKSVLVGLYWSIGVMAVCLFVFGVGRDIAVGERGGGWKRRVRGGIEMVAVGGLAAGASWGIVRALQMAKA